MVSWSAVAHCSAGI